MTERRTSSEPNPVGRRLPDLPEHERALLYRALDFEVEAGRAMREGDFERHEHFSKAARKFHDLYRIFQRRRYGHDSHVQLLHMAAQVGERMEAKLIELEDRVGQIETALKPTETAKVYSIDEGRLKHVERSGSA